MPDFVFNKSIAFNSCRNKNVLSIQLKLTDDNDLLIIARFIIIKVIQ